MARAVFQLDAELWIKRGRPESMLVTHPWRLLVLHCWCGSSGARANGGASADIAEHRQASWDAKEAQSPGWYDSMLRERSLCADCGETYRLENLSVCCGCLRETCGCDFGSEQLNGNRACRICHDEVVG